MKIREIRLFKKIHVGAIVAILGGVGSVSQADPVTTFYLDFGGGFIDTTVNDLRLFNGERAFEGVFYGTGPDLSDNLFSGDPGLQSGDPLEFRPLVYDFNGDGLEDQSDIEALAAAVVPIIERALEPFNINVEVVESASLEEALEKTQESNGFDAYNFAVSVTTSNTTSYFHPVGVYDSGAKTYGLQAFADYNRQPHLDAEVDETDEATLTFVKNILQDLQTLLDGQGLTLAEFNDQFAHLVANVLTHEALHTFAYRHTGGERAAGDVLRGYEPGLTLEDFTSPFIISRFGNDNNYDRAADPVLGFGLRDDDSNGIPNLAYVTGTGLNDRITLSVGGGGVHVLVESDYLGASKVTESYDINWWTETGNTILIDGSNGDDLIIIDASIPLSFRIRGGSGNDSLQIHGDNDFTLTEGQITYRPGLRTANFEEIDHVEITGGTSDNWIEVGDFTGNAVIDGGAGSDFIVAERDADFMLEDSKLTIDNHSVDLIRIEKAWLTGGVGDNFLDASYFNGSTFLFGLAGEDFLVGSSGDDLLDGGAGNDVILGNLGNDVLLGGEDADYLSGGWGFDTLDAGGDIGDVEVQN